MLEMNSEVVKVLSFLYFFCVY